MCGDVGHKEHMSLTDQIRGPYAPCEIRNSMFLPPMKKALMGGIGKNYSFFSYIKIFCPPLVCYVPGAEFFRGNRIFFLAPFSLVFTPDINISALKMESAPVKKKTGHASDCLLVYLSSRSIFPKYQKLFTKLAPGDNRGQVKFHS